MADRKDELFYKQKHLADIMTAEEKALSDEYAEKYKAYIAAAKTERRAVTEAIKLAEANGFVEYVRGMDIAPGTKVYKSIRGKALMLAVIGNRSLAEGINVAAAHVDSPRLDLKQIPLYEDTEIAYFKTHYYGGIRKYQWPTIPLALHGVMIKADGTSVDINIGEDPEDPAFIITDLLPHLARKQRQVTLGEAFSGEALRIIVASTPVEGEGSDRVKLNVMEILNKKYGIVEEDFISAELEAVPAIPVRDIGLDRNIIGAYGHDDRVCAFAELQAMFDVGTPEKTAVCVLADKEEVGSPGITGMGSQAFECFVGDLCDAQGVNILHCFEKSLCLSADVTNAFDPCYPEVSDKPNNAKLNYGLGIAKFTGSGGKSGSNDASAEVVGKVRKMFAENGVTWQMCELGKVDEGGGGTVARFMGDRNIDTIDAGVPVLAMHAPYEFVSRLDCYMTYKGMKALYLNKD